MSEVNGSEKLQANLAAHRDNFPALKNKNYLNFGAQGTMPLSAIEAIRRSYDLVQEKGPLSSGMFAWIQDETLRCKKALAGEFGAAAELFALTQNTTEGCNLVLWGLDWQKGDVLLTTDGEHVGVMKTILQLCKRLGVKLDICKLENLKTDNDVLDCIEKSLANRPRHFILSHVLWNTGRLLPLPEINQLCRKHGVKVCVDGAQAAGVLPLNLQELDTDFYAFTGHKWLCGPEGLGALYVNPASVESLEPTFVGWRSTAFDTAESQLNWLPGAARFESATASFPLLSGLIEAVEVRRRFVTREKRYELILQNAQTLRTELSKLANVRLLDPVGGSSLVSFVIEGVSHSELVQHLELRDTIVRTIPQPDCIRASTHYFSEPELAKFLQSLTEFLSAAKK